MVDRTTMSEVAAMIGQLNRLRTISRADDQTLNPIGSIGNYDQLIKALKELDEMVEMEPVKRSILAQLQFLLLKQWRQLDSSSQSGSMKLRSGHIVGGDLSVGTLTGSFEDHMLHTVIYGPPGVGKTRIGVILAKIWMALDILKPQDRVPENEEQLLNLGKTVFPVILTNRIYERILERMEHKQERTKDRINKLYEAYLEQRRAYERLQSELNYLREQGRFASQRRERRIFNQLQASIEALTANIKTIDEEIQDEHNIETSLRTIIDDLQKSEQRRNGESSSLDGSSIEEDSNWTSDSPITIVSRPDFVAEYLGQSAIKTRKLLEANRGKVLFIDEAYALVHDDKDSYGMEALTVLNQFMSEHSHEIIVIFAGYKDLLEKTIFHRQPGLRRRCTWSFEVPGYSGRGLADIFQRQLASHGWTIESSIDLVSFFEQRKENFPAYGGDTLRLAFYGKLAHAKHNFEQVVKGLDYLVRPVEPNKLITKPILEQAYQHYRSNRVIDITKESSDIPFGIFT